MLDLSYDALRASGAVPHWFGLGFIQLRLNCKQRMQFWHPAFHHPTVEPIHNHRYSFCTRILVGELVNETWRYEPTEGGDAECLEVDSHAEPGDRLRPGTWRMVSTGYLNLSGRTTLTAGSSYYFPTSEFHRTCTRRAVALLCCGTLETHNTRVVRPIGEADSPACAKRMGECWAIIRDLLG